jgi:hypothetical protein
MSLDWCDSCCTVVKWGGADHVCDPERVAARVAELKDRAEKAEAEVEALKCCGNCRHWWPGLLGCALDSSQEVVCEGRDRCKVFVQLADRPETREPSWTRREP